ncbi:hypothetical protein [Stutzerimonas nitrititolerans]|uniref:hypothetical protein n=1 Tax=Stutzerimonas nitrititolerans TaxID=2482751 RepID=UPI0026488F51|nr:hypothetical protein [Stutzerimonas nitrititolerans]
MATVKHHKVVAALPAVLEPDAIYYVRAGQGHDVYVTNGSGMIVGYPANAALGLDGKVDKAEGQSLMTDAERAKLGGIEAGATANATDAQLRDRTTHIGTQAIDTVGGLQAALDEKIDTTERGVSGGVATLDEYARIPSSQLPSYVDDVLEFPTRDDFPATGEGGKIYIAVNQGTQANPTRQYRWTGSVYAEINPSPGTTDALAEGSTNLYFSEHRVRNTVLTGLSLLSSAAITAADTVLSALGKLQAQLGLKAPLDSPAFTGSPTAPTAAADDNDTSIANTAFVRLAMALFGIGGSAKSLVQPDLNEPRPSGLYYCNNPINQPPGAGNGYLDQTDLAAGAYFKQKYVEFAGRVRIWERLFLGVESNPQFLPWEEIWHTGNFDPSTKLTVSPSGMGIGKNAAHMPISSDPGSTLHYVGGLELRESGLLTSSQGSTPEWVRPALVFHWGGYVVRRMSMDAAGTLYWGPNKIAMLSSVEFVGATKELTTADLGKYLRHNVAAEIALYLGHTTTVSSPDGAEITIRAAGPITIVPLSGVVIVPPSGGSLKLTAGMTVTLKKLGGLEWDLIGQTVPA